MLKGVKKGIKKKIKGKKDKKEDDLFDPDQLEKYKKELEEAKKARQQQDEESGASKGATGGAGHEEDEEWLRFKQLTSGVDVLVNKVSTDLDRIKESSFFQRNKPSEQNKLFAGERPANAIVPGADQEPHLEDHVPEDDGHQSPTEERKPEGEDELDGIPKVPDSPEIVPVELDDSLFDTGFVDAIATGEIKLAYIPDSPTQEEGDDPFDTHEYDVIAKKIEEEERKAKRQVNLGDTVEFLTGKGGDKTAVARPRARPGAGAKARPRPHAVNLLGDYDDASMPTAPPPDTSKANGQPEKPKDLFDKILDSPSKDASSPLLEKVDLLPGKVTDEKKSVTPNEDKIIKDVLDEFDVLDAISSEAEPLPTGVPSSIPSSIAALLAPEPEPEDELDDEFAALAAESIHKGQPPPPEEPEEEEQEDDPFDTSYVQATEKGEMLGEVESSEDTKPKEKNEDDDFDFDPRMGESPPKTLQIQNAPKVNPLEDMSPTVVKAPVIQPSAGPTTADGVDGKEGESEAPPDEDVDPFDTSRLEKVMPGKHELKMLEAELMNLEQPSLEPPKLPEKIVTAIIKSQQTVDDDFDFDPRKDEVKHHVLDLHDADHHAFDNVSKVMTPQEEIDIELDPFDTSAAAGLVPGALELRLLENELVSPAKEEAPPLPAATVQSTAPLTRADSDEDFDPRCGVPAPVIAAKPPPTTEDIFDSTMDFAVDKPLTPLQEMPSTAIPEPKLCPVNPDDPFDTSGIEIENYLAKSELKQMEEELLNAPEQPLPARTLPVIVGVEYKRPPQQAPPHPPPPEPFEPHPLEAITPTEHSFKPLTPTEIPSAMSGVISVFNPSPMADPFDTSIADVVMPGKTEIKLLEEELGVGAGMGRRLSDDDFNPRNPSHQIVYATLAPMKVQAPVNSDPFDTSSTESGMPGKAELKALEAELL